MLSESFPLQLGNCLSKIDVAESKAKEMEREACNVRSAGEQRRGRAGTVREVLERERGKTEGRRASGVRGRGGQRPQPECWRN